MKNKVSMQMLPKCGDVAIGVQYHTLATTVSASTTDSRKRQRKNHEQSEEAVNYNKKKQNQIFHVCQVCVSPISQATPEDI